MPYKEVDVKAVNVCYSIWVFKIYTQYSIARHTAQADKGRSEHTRRLSQECLALPWAVLYNALSVNPLYI